MSQDSSPQIEIERAAEIAIANAKERREKAGWGGDDARAKIESLLSAEDIAQVNMPKCRPSSNALSATCKPVWRRARHRAPRQRRRGARVR